MRPVHKMVLPHKLLNSVTSSVSPTETWGIESHDRTIGGPLTCLQVYKFTSLSLTFSQVVSVTPHVLSF